MKIDLNNFVGDTTFIAEFILRNSTKSKRKRFLDGSLIRPITSYWPEPVPEPLQDPSRNLTEPLLSHYGMFD